MTRTFAAALRRANRLMRPAKLTKTTRSIGKAMAGLMVKTALAPLGGPKPRRTGPKPGRTLGAVLKHLKAAQALMQGTGKTTAKRKAAPRIPKGAHYHARRHRCAAGSRAYQLYLPASQPKQPKGLILMLHGCDQTPDDFALGTHMNALAEKHGLAIAYPAQTGRENAARCWNWFKPENQRRGTGEPEILASLARKLMKDFGLKREGVFVAGLSAGGAMAAILADVYPDIFSAAGIHSGLARGTAHDVLSAITTMRYGGTSDPVTLGAASPTTLVRRIVFQGDADPTIHPSNAATIVASAVATAEPTKIFNGSVRGRGYIRSTYAGTDGGVALELWMLRGVGHAWSGGRAAGSYSDVKGPDASAQMVRFFLSSAG